MRVGVDLDGTISAYPLVFREFLKAMRRAGHLVYVITDREPGSEEAVREELDRYGIVYDVLKITGDKAGYVREMGIGVLFDDTDEYFAELGEDVAVFKIRQHYNYDFGEKKWLYTDATGKLRGEVEK